MIFAGITDVSELKQIAWNPCAASVSTSFPRPSGTACRLWAATLPARNNNYLPYDRRTRTVLPISGGTPFTPHFPAYPNIGSMAVDVKPNAFPSFVSAPVLLQRLHPVSVQHRFRYPVPSPILQFLFRERLLHRPVRAWLVFRLCRPFFRPGRFCRSVTVHPVSFRQRDNPHGSLPFPYRFRRYILADTQTQLTVYRFQYLHEVGGVLAVQPLIFATIKKQSPEKSPVPEVFHPVRFATAVIIHVARSLAVPRTAGSGNSCLPATSRAGSGGTRPARYSSLPVFPLFLTIQLCIYVHAKGVVQSSGRSACRAFPASTVPELFHVRAAVADFLPADGEGDNPVRAVALQGTGADFEIFAIPRCPSSTCPSSGCSSLPVPAARPVPFAGTLPRMPLSRLSSPRGRQTLCSRCYYFHNLFDF